MPVESEQTVTVSCDNPNCPGHPYLDPSDMTGWIIVNHEVYGQPSAQHVFGSYECVSATSGNAESPMMVEAAQKAEEFKAQQESLAAADTQAAATIAESQPQPTNEPVADTTATPTTA